MDFGMNWLMPSPYGLHPTDDCYEEEEAALAAALALGYLPVSGNGAPQHPRYSVPRVIVQQQQQHSLVIPSKLG